MVSMIPGGTPPHRVSGPARLLSPLHFLERPMSIDQTFYGSDFGQLSSQDPEIAGVLLSELDRRRGGLQLAEGHRAGGRARRAALPRSPDPGCSADRSRSRRRSGRWTWVAPENVTVTEGGLAHSPYGGACRPGSS